MKLLTQLFLLLKTPSLWKNWWRYFAIISISFIFNLAFLGFNNPTFNNAWADAQIAPETSHPKSYKFRQFHSPDGIGKFYLGREIAKVMGHQEALWLERSTREIEEKPNQLITALTLKPTDQVADIGAGTGYFSFRMAHLLPQGRVFAVDIQPEMLNILKFLKQENQVENVEPILGTEQSPNLHPNTIDLALLVDAYHEFSYPKEMMENLVAALKSEGRVALVEYRAENPFIPIKGLHKMSQRQAQKEMAAVGLRWQETQELLPQQHIMVFQKM